MSRDSFVQLVALTLVVACLAGTTMLVPHINSQRRELQLSFDITVGDRQAPTYAIIAAGLGSFRGLATNVLWYRAERLKQEGKFWEAATLAEWITTLQPRFPQVWSFHAWNMAYNISVQTHTEEERWNWVNKGVRLLREEGVPNNPTAIRLYRELGWIFFHKFGQYADDMHWYYKLKLAEEWQEVLGTPVQGADHEQAVANFEPVAVMADRYIQLDRPSRQVRSELRALAEQYPDHADELIELSHRTVTRLIDRAPRIAASLHDDRQFQPAEQLTAMVERTRERRDRARPDALTLLYEDVPEAAAAAARLRELGFEPDFVTLRRIGRLEMYLLYVNPQVMIEQGREAMGLSDQDIAMVRFLMAPEHADGMYALMAFLRARLLVEHYHMDPQFMHQLMVDFGPLDWRHPATHGVYWSALGVDMIREVRDTAGVDMVNTNRQVIHGLQQLVRAGRVNFDPMSGKVDTLPEPAFIPAYEIAMFDAERRAQAMGRSEGVLQSFEGGHENFLQTAILYTYLYGDVDDAGEYYRRLRERYGERNGRRNTRYEMPLNDLVVTILEEEIGRMDYARQFIDAMVIQALTRGLAQGRGEVFNRFIGVARGAYNRYQSEQAHATANVQRDRMSLPATFNQAFVETYISFMRSPGTSIIERSRIYHNTPPNVRQQVFPAIRAQVHEQAAQAGYDPDLAFPAPESQAAPAPDAQPRVPDTLERR